MFVFVPNDHLLWNKKRASDLSFVSTLLVWAPLRSLPPRSDSPPRCCFHFRGEQHPENEAVSPADWTDPVHMMWCVEIRVGSGPHPHIWIIEAGAPSGQLAVISGHFLLSHWSSFFFSSFSQSSAVRFQPWQKRGPAAWIQWAVNNRQTRWIHLHSLYFTYKGWCMGALVTGHLRDVSFSSGKKVSADIKTHTGFHCHLLVLSWIGLLSQTIEF